MDAPRAKKAKRRRSLARGRGRGRSTCKIGCKCALYRPPSFTLNRQVFNILPSYFFHERVHSILSAVPIQLIERLEMISHWKKDPFPDSYETKSKDPMCMFWSKEIVPALIKANNTVDKFRWIFRRFLHRWRTSRLRKVNEDDLATLEKPVRPVYIVDWAHRHVYTFEASTLMRDITTRLLAHDGFFDTVQEPRNPLTNIPLTQSQTLSVWNQLARSGIPASAAFAMFRQIRWKISRFITEHHTFLSLSAFRTTMREQRGMDYRERMMDFIHMAYDMESYDCYVSAFEHAMKKYPQNEIIVRWTNLCTNYYETEILYASRNPLRMRAIQTSILNQTSALLHRQIELRRLMCLDTRLMRNGIQILLSN